MIAASGWWISELPNQPFQRAGGPRRCFQSDVSPGRPPLNFFDELFGILQTCPSGLAIVLDRLDLVTTPEGFHHRCRQICVGVVLETRISE